MKMYKLSFFFFLSSFFFNGQTCLHKKLSKNFNFEINLKRINESDCEISLIVIDKETEKNIQIIKLNSDFIFEKDFKDCSTVRSYSTGINKRLVAEDNDYGDFIVADFNFDGKEDFAIKKDSGGNGGPFYFYYLQNNNSKFLMDKFLSESVEFFPIIINSRKKTLTTLVHANAYQQGKTIFKYNPKNRKWKILSKTLVEY